MKAILVVDIPDDYDEYGSGDWYVIGDDLRIVYEEDGALMDYKYIDDDIAQLKSMPQKEDLNERFEVRCSDDELEIVVAHARGYQYGWNDCIDEMLGEDE